MITKKVKIRAGYPIEFEVSDGHLMVNATSLCTAWGFYVMSWALANSTRRYFYYVKDAANFPDGFLIERRRGSDPSEDDLWIHESLMLRLGQWIDDNYVDLQQLIDCQGYAPAKVERQFEKWLAQLLPGSRVKQLRQKHIEVIYVEAQFLERHTFL